MSLITFNEFKPSEPTRNGKTAPAKVKGDDNKWYALSRDVDSALVLSAVADGFPLEVETATKESTVNGKRYVNHYLNKASKPIQRTEPIGEAPRQPVITTPAQPQLPARPAAGNGGAAVTPPPRPFIDDAAKQRLIVRQSSLRAAVEYSVKDPAAVSAEEVLALADYFVRWVFEEEEAAYDLAEVKRGGGSAEHSIGEASKAESQSPAQQYLAEARKKLQDVTGTYEDEDAVCPGCGRKEFLKQYAGGWFCAKSKVDGEPGGCGYPRKGERLDAPVTWGEFKQRSAANVRRPDATVLSPTTHPGRPTQ